MIGSFHEDGWVVERDIVEAAHYYELAAKGGDFRGQFNHARMLVEKGDKEGARNWLTRLGETATPAFLARLRQWSLQQDDPFWSEAIGALAP
ncbi:MAG: SEL1-like repeat protein [Sphingobium sp.]